VVGFSLLLYAGMVVAMVLLIIRRRMEGFALAFYLFFFVLVCNLVVNVGAPMGERFLFHPSVGFAILAAELLSFIYARMAGSRQALIGLASLLAVVTVLSGFRTIERNRDWDTDATLFLHDVNTVPNSIIVNCNAGAACLDKEEEAKDSLTKRAWLLKGLPYLDKAISLHRKYMLAYINRGIIYFKLNEFEKALSDCDTVRKYFPQHPTLAYLSYSLSDHYFKLGIANGRANNPEGAILYFGKAIEAMPNDADVWYNLGYAHFTLNHYDEARKAFINALRVKPGHAQARNMLEQLKKLP
jgi:tetratricopeptide (TPR) repeat protein